MAIVISILSLGVAAFSLYFSISTQQLDRVYKEVSILPRLAIKLDVENFSISLDNSGLGPAVIHRVRFAIAGKCYDSDDSKSYQQKFREFTEGVFTYGIYKDTCRLLHTPSVKALPCDPGSLFPYVTVDPRAVKDIFASERVEVIAIKQQFANATRDLAACKLEAFRILPAEIIFPSQKWRNLVDFCMIAKGISSISPHRRRGALIALTKSVLPRPGGLDFQIRTLPTIEIAGVSKRYFVGKRPDHPAGGSRAWCAARPHLRYPTPLEAEGGADLLPCRSLTPS